jgi:DNA-binding MarR family transcriptional regulator
VRRAARLVTQLYDDELRGQMEASQFALLSAVDQAAGTNQSSLARALGLDKTTISRNLRLIEKNGWITRDDGLRLTAYGRERLASARPHWHRAQERLRSAMSAEQWTAMRAVLGDLTEAMDKTLSLSSP